MNCSCIECSAQHVAHVLAEKHSMHLRNSCTRSMSAWAMRQVPSARRDGRGLELLDSFLDSIVPGDVGDQVLDNGMLSSARP